MAHTIKFRTDSLEGPPRVVLLARAIRFCVRGGRVTEERESNERDFATKI